MLRVKQRTVMPHGVYAAYVDRITAHWQAWLSRNDGLSWIKPLQDRLDYATQPGARKALGRTLRLVKQRIGMFDLRQSGK